MPPTTTKPPCVTSSTIHTEIIRIKDADFCANITVLKAPSIVRGVSGYAYHFSSSESAIAITSNDFTETCFGQPARCVNGFTISFWINRNREFSNSSCFLIRSPERELLEVGITASSFLFVNIRTLKTKWRLKYHINMFSIWRHVVITWVGDDVPLLYVDSVRVSPQFNWQTGTIDKANFFTMACNCTGYMLSNFEMEPSKKSWVTIKKMYLEGIF